MSGTVSTLISSKGESAPSGSKPVAKSGFDHLDVNRLFKGKTAEPTAKQITQKHGMQTLGKALPARRAGASGLTSEVTTEEPSVTPVNQIQNYKLPIPPGEPAPSNQDLLNQGWTGQHLPPPPQQALHLPNQIPPLMEKKWSGGRGDMNYPSSRFAQEFPTLDAAVGDVMKGQGASTITGPGPGPGPGGRVQAVVAKTTDNQYGPGPILRPQTEGSWIQGGGGGRRTSPPNQLPMFPPDRGPVGPMPPQMSLGGQIPPPLGAYPTYRPNPPNAYQKPGGIGGYYQTTGGPCPGSGPNSQGPIRFGMPIPLDTPPPSGPPGIVSLRRGPPTRPSAHFAAKPIIRAEDLERMDEIGVKEGDWASSNDDVDYNKKINFSDEEDHVQPRRSTPPGQKTLPLDEGRDRDRPPPRILERDREEDRERLSRPDGRVQRDIDEDWRPIRVSERDWDRGGRRGRDEDWRSGSNRTVGEDFRGQKLQPSQRDIRPNDYTANKYQANIPPRFRQQQQQQQPPQILPNQLPQRQTPSPKSNAVAVKDPPTYKILERKRVDTEPSREIPKEVSEKRNSISDQGEIRSLDLAKETTKKRDEKRKEEPEKRITTSWAEEMDDDDSLSEIAEVRKGPSPILKKEERRDRIESKRFIKQTKVADMTSLKSESTVVKAKESSPPATHQQQVQQPDGKPKVTSAWGDVDKHLSDGAQTKSPPRVQTEEKPQITEFITSVTEPEQKFSDETQQLISPITQSGKNAVEKVVAPPNTEKLGTMEPTGYHEVPIGNKEELPKEVVQLPQAPVTPQLAASEPLKKEAGRDSERRVSDRGDYDQFHRRGVKFQPPRKNLREQRDPRHPLPQNHSNKRDEQVTETVKDDERKREITQQRRPQPTTNLPKHNDNNIHYEKDSKPVSSGDRSDYRKDEGDRRDKRREYPHHGPRHSKSLELKPTTKVEEVKEKHAVAYEDGKRDEKPSSAWADKRKTSGERKSKMEDEVKEQPVAGKDVQEETRKVDDESVFRRGNKSPNATKRNPPTHVSRSGSSRLQGYGPPSDRSPFSSNASKEKEDEEKKEKEKKEGHMQSTRVVIPPPTSGPIPLMALGEISPPDMPPRSRHHDYNRPPRFLRDRTFPQQRGHKQTNYRGKSHRKDSSKETDTDTTNSNGTSNWNCKSFRSNPAPLTPLTPIPNEEGVKQIPAADVLPKEAQPSVPGPEIIPNASKVPTMVFENTKLKLSSESQQYGRGFPMKSQKDDLTFSGGGMEKSTIEQLKQSVSLQYPPDPSPVKLDFGSAFGEDGDNGKSTSGFLHQASRPFPHISQRTMSPLQADLTENIQAIRSIWESPSLPSDQSVPPPDSSMVTQFGQDAFKESDSPLTSLGQPIGQNGYGSGVLSSVSVIAKPNSSSSPNGALRQQIKSLQHTIESTQQQSHIPLTYSPFGYGLTQAANAFGTIGGVPSPPSMYAKNPPPGTPLYQQFAHQESSHVIGIISAGRTHSQFGNYAGVGGTGGSAHYGSLYCTIDNPYSTYTTHSGGPPQPPLQASLSIQSNNRISPGLPPPPTTVSGLPLTGILNSSAAPGSNSFKTVRNVNQSSHPPPPLHHQNSQPFSQISHLPHPHLAPIGPQKGQFQQPPLPQTQPQIYIPYDPNQSMMNLGQSYGGLRAGTGPQPSATPPMQGISNSSYYPPTAQSAGVYQQQNPGSGGLQGLQVAPPGPNAFGLQFQPANMTPYNSQGPSGGMSASSLARSHGPRK